MKGKSTFKLIISEITAVGINVVPLALWWFEDYSAETTMILYALESCVGIIFAVLCVLLLSPKRAKSDEVEKRRWRKMMADFLILSGFWAGIVMTMMFAFIFLVLKAKVSAAEIKFGMLCIIAFQLFEFFSNLFLLRPLSFRDAQLLLEGNFGGLALLHISIFIGGFLAAFVNEWYVLPFIVFKTFINISAPIQYFKKRIDVARA